MTAPKPDLSAGQLHDLISEELRLHPLAKPVDYYKLVYQAAYGPSHMTADYETIKRYLKAELSAMGESYQPYCQDLGDKSGYLRISLSLLFANPDAGVDLLSKLILQSMIPDGIDPEDWMLVWSRALPILEQIIPIRSADLEAIKQLLNSDQIPHHSPQYRATYHPHYRIIHQNCLQELQDTLGFKDILEIK